MNGNKRAKYLFFSDLPVNDCTNLQLDYFKAATFLPGDFEQIYWIAGNLFSVSLL
ncbi:MAG: hypothetical protein JNM21_16055 [Taibaiella sp.]|nr:hypothetical protein [Taibaiella sp.]